MNRPFTADTFMDSFEDVNLIDYQVINEHQNKLTFSFREGMVEFRKVIIFVDEYGYIHNLNAPAVVWGNVELSYNDTYYFNSEYWLNGYMISSDRDGFNSHPSVMEAKLNKLGL